MKQDFFGLNLYIAKKKKKKKILEDFETPQEQSFRYVQNKRQELIRNVLSRNVLNLRVLFARSSLQSYSLSHFPTSEYSREISQSDSSSLVSFSKGKAMFEVMDSGTKRRLLGFIFCARESTLHG